MTPSSHQAVHNNHTPHNHTTLGSHQPSGNHQQFSSEGSPEQGAGEFGRSEFGSEIGSEIGGEIGGGIRSPQPSPAPINEAAAKLALELKQFSAIANKLRSELVPAATFTERCSQAFEIANDLFSNAPTWVCFYRELMGAAGMLHDLFQVNKDFGSFLRTDQHHQIQGMLTALRSRDLPESDPNDPQRMITVRLPKSLHEAMCEEATRLNISVNRLCISRMLQLLDPDMIPETNSKPRGRKPRTRSKAASGATANTPEASPATTPANRPETSSQFEFISTSNRP